MSRLYRSLSSLFDMIDGAFAVTASLRSRRRPSDADLRRAGIDPASFTVRL